MSDDVEEPTRLHTAAAIGTIAGGDPSQSTRARMNAWRARVE